MNGKVALVTGASRGIGRAVAIELAKNGVNLIINYSGSEEAAKEVLKEVTKLGIQAYIYKANVGNYNECAAMVEFAIEKFSKIDILVNNAGITKDMLLMRMSEEQFDDVININLKGTFNCMQLVSKYMIKAKSGRIINMASVSGRLGNAGQVNYAASKAGVEGMTKAAAREMAARGITVNAIAPGFVKTDMTDVLSDKVKENIIESIPMKTFGIPEDIAKTVVFLAGEGARYITGQTISVDGGMYM
jgi:3-oxoacyl-[acyl-carrier-protein] reductase